ncbi:hypothetical protein TA3x_000432 [Tundrisphaera sp. TA3]
MKQNVITQGGPYAAKNYTLGADIGTETLILVGLALVLIAWMASMFLFRK